MCCYIFIFVFDFLTPSPAGCSLHTVIVQPISHAGDRPDIVIIDLNTLMTELICQVRHENIENISAVAAVLAARPLGACTGVMVRAMAAYGVPRINSVKDLLTLRNVVDASSMPDVIAVVIGHMEDKPEGLMASENDDRLAQHKHASFYQVHCKWNTLTR